MSGIDEYQIVVASQDQNDPFSMDKLVIRLALEKGADASVADHTSSEVRRLTNLRPDLEFVARDQIYDPTTALKPKRIVDLRPPR